MHITHEMNMHNCQLCRKEWLGRCFGKKYGKDVSVDNEPCKCYEFGGSKERLKEIENNIKSIDHEVCDYDEAYNRESASDIGWCGKCKIPECPYNKDLNEKKRMGWNNTMKR